MDLPTPSGVQTPHRIDIGRALSTPIRELGESERSLYLEHLIALGGEDRYLRFGSPIQDEAIASYVRTIDFRTDTVFGIFDDSLALAAAGHFAPLPDRREDSILKRTAEFGLSVDANARGKGLGTALFLRASAHARNLDIGMLFMHCLSENRAMMRIARKAGMEISQTHGEADAYLALTPGDRDSAMEERVQRQIALFDFAIKQQILRSRNAIAEARADTAI